tara:strand:- start:14 stop:211 length:198 start_codon:yes stop_codon:yes gene_type:complete
VPLLFGIIGDIMSNKDKEQDIITGFKLPYPEFVAPKVVIKGDAVKVPGTEREPDKNNWDGSYNDD